MLLGNAYCPTAKKNKNGKFYQHFFPGQLNGMG